MIRYRVLNWLVGVFALERRIDYFIKPIMTLLVYVLCFAAVSLIVYHPSWDDLKPILLTVVLTQAPFMGLAFLLVHFLSLLRGQLADMALTDVLTGLPNRRAFMHDAERMQEDGTTGHILILDADHFKRINDTHGHAIGDICLQAIAERLRSVRQPQDLIARIGGEEFGVFLPYATQADVGRFGQRMCQSIRVHLPEGTAPIMLTLSIGAAETRQGEDTMLALSRADEALYAVKENGRGHMRIWQQTLPHKVA